MKLLSAPRPPARVSQAAPQPSRSAVPDRASANRASGRAENPREKLTRSRSLPLAIWRTTSARRGRSPKKWGEPGTNTALAENVFGRSAPVKWKPATDLVWWQPLHDTSFRRVKKPAGDLTFFR